MWINRETWQKVLQWSRKHRFWLVLMAATVLIWVASSPEAAAQEQPARAVLLRGPISVKGIPVYTPNRIPAFAGEYSLEVDSGQQPRTVTVLFTRQRLFIPEQWVLRRCGVLRLYAVPEYETFALCYQDERGFYLFFLFPDTEEPGDWCAFTDRFIERFLFLYNFVDNETDVPFPAILQVGQG
jgi:hypothetical protein